MILIWLGVALTALAVAFGLFVLFAILGTALAGAAINFSRIAFGLFVALAISQSTALMGMTGFTNYLGWATITLIATFLLCRFPRIGSAIKFLATFFISYLAIMLGVFFVMSLVLTIMGQSFAFTLVYQITILVISLLLAIFSVIKEITNQDRTDSIIFQHPVFVTFERAIASLLYGFILLVIFSMATASFFSISIPVQWIILGVFAAFAYIADAILPGTPFMNKLQDVSITLNNKVPTPEQKRKNMIDALK